jgi:hypothetical protein
MADGIGSGMRELADAIRTFSDDVRDAMREREVELREGAGLDGELGNRPSAPGRHAAGDPEAPPA